ncbi:hypothetical protein EDD86DRAFT_109556 [Gorgonomyces haynaldii]|nr:hypothetical protein EDD86DRAFT_109556 [Gorgonomyces haynaldii]
MSKTDRERRLMEMSLKRQSQRENRSIAFSSDSDSEEPGITEQPAQQIISISSTQSDKRARTITISDSDNENPFETPKNKEPVMIDSDDSIVTPRQSKIQVISDSEDEKRDPLEAMFDDDEPTKKTSARRRTGERRRSTDSDSSRDKRRRKRKKRYSSSDGSETESGSDNDVSFYRNIDQNTFFRDAHQKKNQIKKEIKQFKRTVEMHKQDDRYMLLDDCMDQIIDGKHPRLSRIVSMIMSNDKPDDYGDLTVNEMQQASQLPIYVEKEFVRVVFPLMEAANLEPSYLEDYDSKRVEEFFLQLNLFTENENRQPIFIQGFVDKVKNVLLPSMASGSYRRGTDVEVDADLAKDVHYYLLFGNIHMRNLDFDTILESSMMLKNYSEIRDEHCKQRMFKKGGSDGKLTVTEKDRQYALEKLYQQKDDVTKIMCQICQSFPRSVTKTVSLYPADKTRFEDESSDEEEVEHRLVCTDACAEIVEQVGLVSQVWQSLYLFGPSLLRIPSIIHRYHRQDPEYTGFELLKILYFVWFSTTKARVRETNPCKHYLYSQALRK